MDPDARLRAWIRAWDRDVDETWLGWVRKELVDYAALRPTSNEPQGQERIAPISGASGGVVGPIK